MSEKRAFFLPGVAPEEQETTYAALAEGCRCAVPSKNSRIYSITFMHDGVEWTATVGETLTGTGKRSRRSKGKKIEEVTHHSDPAVVMAIFAGNPYMVWINATRTAWQQPYFMAGIPKTSVHFS